MNRELKFKAYHKGRKEMYDVFSLAPDYVFKDTLDGVGCPGCPDNREDVEVLQYTGLKDEDGKEIYDGDICDDNKRPWVVKQLDGGAWALDYANGSGEKYLYPINRHIKRIGNIHTNPDLIKP